MARVFNAIGASALSTTPSYRPPRAWRVELANNSESVWEELLVEGNPTMEKSRAVFRVIPSDPRCMFCNSPFHGLGRRIMPLIGRGQSHEDPRFCNACINYGRRNPGGAEVELATMFADVRGSTPLAEKIGNRAFRDLIDRFFKTSSEVLVGSGALLGRLAGDQAIGYFVPGIAGPEYAQAALKSARDLLVATGHTESDGPWIPLGVGLHAGTGYVGMVGSPGEPMELTALGDDINVGSRISDAARTGEILASLQLAETAGLDVDALEHRELTLKGKEESMEVVVISPVRASPKA
jgi:adenylate cyclase